ncbi:ABC transporter substrate-binding protein [Pelobacter seleniigenes]|uniref:ABC transporter substrate-binding protein n=1 Tax=Pelobacter seleniigenes TaxID=407188 RepID=UPI0004A737A4|nr:ABC transporter substrate binding protein [Pelobacter seleniigenes]
MFKTWLYLLIFLSLPAAAFSARLFPSIAMFEWQGDGIVEKGFRDGLQKFFPDARFYVYNLAGDENLLPYYLKAAKERQHDLYYVSGTDLTRRLLALEKQHTVVFTMVQAPVEEGLIASWRSSENNATGISNSVPLLNQLKALKRIRDFQHLGVLWQPNNPESRQQVDELFRLQPFLHYQLHKINLLEMSDNVVLSPEILSTLDSVYITNAPLFKHVGDKIISQLNEARIPSLTADMTFVTSQGALLGLVPDKYRIGRLAALNAQKALQGFLPEQIPSRSLDFFMVVLNMQTARKIRVQVPFSLLVIADTIIH